MTMKIEPEVLEKVLAALAPTDNTDEMAKGVRYALALLASVKEQGDAQDKLFCETPVEQGGLGIKNIPYADGSPSREWEHEATETKPDAPSDAEKLVEFIREERNAIFYSMTTGSSYDVGLAKERMTQVILDWERIGKSAQPKVKEVTVEEISRIIQKWHFDDSTGGPFGAYLMRLYPNGLRVIPAAGEKP